MKKQFLRAGMLLGLSLILTGCSTELFVPKALNDNARGISAVSITPIGCRALGEVEGKDEKKPLAGVFVVGSSLLTLREGAMNDLRNNAADVVGSFKKRTVLKVISETAFCSKGHCPNQQFESKDMHSYLVKAEIYDCGNK